MRKSNRWLTFLAIFFAAFHNTMLVAQSPDVQRHVVVISIDGFAAFLVDDPKVPLPNIRRLARKGCIVEGGMTRFGSFRDLAQSHNHVDRHEAW